jgi:hypothetical protein
MYTAKGHLDRNAMIKQYQPLVPQAGPPHDGQTAPQHSGRRL